MSKAASVKHIDKYESIRNIAELYSKNKVLPISEEEFFNGYNEMRDINLSLAEECICCDNKCAAEYESYLVSNINHQERSRNIIRQNIQL